MPTKTQSNVRDVVIVGAGAAGLAAAVSLQKRGKSFVILEARDRIGGRVYTVKQDRGEPIELGAEFVHGYPEEVHDLIRPDELRQKKGDFIAVGEDGKWNAKPDFFEKISHVMQRLCTLRGKDISFSQFLKRHCSDIPPDTQHQVQRYVEGYHGANVTPSQRKSFGKY